MVTCLDHQEAEMIKSRVVTCLDHIEKRDFIIRQGTRMMMSCYFTYIRSFIGNEPGVLHLQTIAIVHSFYNYVSILFPFNFPFPLLFPFLFLFLLPFLFPFPFLFLVPFLFRLFSRFQSRFIFYYIPVLRGDNFLY